MTSIDNGQGDGGVGDDGGGPPVQSLFCTCSSHSDTPPTQWGRSSSFYLRLCMYDVWPLIFEYTSPLFFFVMRPNSLSMDLLISSRKPLLKVENPLWCGRQ